jgi:hypothetical protein
MMRIEWMVTDFLDSMNRVYLFALAQKRIMSFLSKKSVTIHSIRIIRMPLSLV